MNDKRMPTADSSKQSQPRGIRIWRGLCAVGVIVMLLASPGAVWAQGKKRGSQAEEVKEKSLTMPYVFTILLIGIGVATACVGSPRQSGNLDRDLA